MVDERQVDGDLVLVDADPELGTHALVDDVAEILEREHVPDLVELERDLRQAEVVAELERPDLEKRCREHVAAANVRLERFDVRILGKAHRL